MANVCKNCGGRGVVYLGMVDDEDKYERCEECGGIAAPLDKQKSMLEMAVVNFKAACDFIVGSPARKRRVARKGKRR